MSDQHNEGAGPQIAAFPTPPQNPHTKLNSLLAVHAAMAGVLTYVIGVQPDTATVNSTEEQVVVWPDPDTGMTLAALQFVAPTEAGNGGPLVRINNNLSKRILWTVLGFVTDASISWDYLSEPAEDQSSAIAWGSKGGKVQVAPELMGSEAEIKAAVETLNSVLNAAKAKARAETKGETDEAS